MSPNSDGLVSQLKLLDAWIKFYETAFRLCEREQLVSCVKLALKNNSIAQMRLTSPPFISSRFARNWRVRVQFIDFLDSFESDDACRFKFHETKAQLRPLRLFSALSLNFKDKVAVDLQVSRILLQFRCLLFCFCIVGHTWLVYSWEIICIFMAHRKPCGIGHKASRRSAKQCRRSTRWSEHISHRTCSRTTANRKPQTTRLYLFLSSSENLTLY